jgi:hypothetical protein
MTWKPPAPGVLDDTVWPEQLIARAVLPGDADDRLHGYSVLGDIARHYRYSDLVYLTVVGELPDARASGLFHIALCSLATIAVNEAPAHIGVLSRICGGTFAAAFGAGALAAADDARHKLDAHVGLLAWLSDPNDVVPDEFTSTEVEHREWVRTLRGLIKDASLVRSEMTRDAARIALLFEAGLRNRDAIEAAMVVARVCGLAPEILATGPQDIGSYPVTLPPFQYVEGGEE